MIKRSLLFLMIFLILVFSGYVSADEPVPQGTIPPPGTVTPVVPSVEEKGGGAAEPEIIFKPVSISKDETWEGEIHIQDGVTVNKGVTVTVREGTRIILHHKGQIYVFGDFVAKGSMGKEIVFDSSPELKETGEKYYGLKLDGVSRKSVVENCVIKNSQAGISLFMASISIKNNVFDNCDVAIDLYKESEPLIERNLIKNGGDGIKIQMKSSPIIIRNYIKNMLSDGINIIQSSNSRIFNNTIAFTGRGISTQQGVMAEIRGNTINNSAAGIYSYQVGPEEKILANHISNCEVGIRGDGFSQAAITGNIIESNSEGIVMLQFSTSEIRHNEITGNSKGVVAFRKCDLIIEKNDIHDNDIGIFCDFSSYPRIKDNNILDNEFAVQLGSYQSSDWEKSAGSSNIIRQQATQKQSKANFNNANLVSVKEFVDVSGNFWGDEVTKEMEQKGADGNISIIFDYYDKNTVTYQGFGDTEYKLDKVKYDGWLTKIVQSTARHETRDEIKGNPLDISD